MRWDLCQVVVLCAIAVLVPLRLSFTAVQDNIPVTWFVYDMVTDLYFYVDIVLNFRTAFEDTDGTLVDDKKKVAWRYLKSWFPIDVC
eukprot:COSAG01_NODE_32230_length_584_cov_1.622680_2_plen_86_part_01